VHPFLTEDLVEEELAHHALAHETPLHVGEHHEDRVDIPVPDHLLEGAPI
jgi:hypothetical protein